MLQYHRTSFWLTDRRPFPQTIDLTYILVFCQTIKDLTFLTVIAPLAWHRVSKMRNEFAEKIPCPLKPRENCGNRSQNTIYGGHNRSPLPQIVLFRFTTPLS